MKMGSYKIQIKKNDIRFKCYIGKPYYGQWRKKIIENYNNNLFGIVWLRQIIIELNGKDSKEGYENGNWAQIHE